MPSTLALPASARVAVHLRLRRLRLSLSSLTRLCYVVGNVACSAASVRIFPYLTTKMSISRLNRDRFW